MEKIPDMELIEKARNGDVVAFGSLADRYYMTVYRYAFKWCRSREDAEDITQEVFIKLGANMHKFNKKSLFTTWLYKVVANCARDYARKNKNWRDRKLPEPPADRQVASPAPGPENTVIARSILQLVHDLPEKQKEAVLLVYAEELQHGEAARVIGCAETTVSWRIFQAKRRLKKVLS